VDEYHLTGQGFSLQAAEQRWPRFLPRWRANGIIMDESQQLSSQRMNIIQIGRGFFSPNNRTRFHLDSANGVVVDECPQQVILGDDYHPRGSFFMTLMCPPPPLPLTRQKARIVRALSLTRGSSAFFFPRFPRLCFSSAAPNPSSRK
jgi:hypothetical protein